MKPHGLSITDISSILTAIISLIIAITVPTAYFIITYQYMIGSANTEMVLSAREVERLVINNPTSWQFEEIRLQEILERRIDHSYRDNRIIRDLRGNIVAETKGHLARPVLTVNQPIFDSGMIVGRIELKRSFDALIVRTSFICVFSILLAITIFFIFRLFPLRAIRETYHLLEENEQRLKLALASGYFGILDWDMEKNIMVWDDGMYATYGVPRDSPEMSLKVWQDCIHPEDREQFLKNIRPEVMGERGYNTEFRILRSDGTVRHIKADGVVIFDEYKKPSRLICLNNDITERRQAEDALLASEERFKSIVTTSNEWIWAMNTAGIHTFSNPAVENILGYHPDKIVGQHDIGSFIHEEDLPKIKELLAQCIMQKAGWSHITLRWKHRDGTYRYLESCATPITDRTGALLGFQGSDRDVTTRQKAEDAIRKSEEQYRTIFESTATANIIIAEDSTIRMANNNFVNLSGYTKQEVEGKMSWTSFIYKDDLEKMKNYHIMRRRDPGSAPASYEFRAITRQGDVLDLFMSVAIVPGTKESVVSFVDLTERKLLEAQLIQAQKMEAIGTLSGGVAHDFNNILMSIQGYISLIIMDTGGDHPHYEWLKLIEEQAKSAADLTKQLLGFARGGKYEVKPTDMNDVIQKTSTMFGRTKKELVIHSKYEKDIWAVEADRSQIEQVFLNLYLNAWQAMPAGGDLALETRNVIVDENYTKTHAMTPGRYVRISVGDTGVGMDEETKKRIFEPFFTTKKFGGGNGLGLAMVYGIIKNHNGFIDVNSAPDKGTTFVIHIPASSRDVIKNKSFTQTILKGTETILFVDDEPNVLMVSRKILESLGYTVYGVKDGKEAIAFYRENKDSIDLIVIDMIMPGLSGNEVFDQIRELNPMARIILSSGYSLNEQAQQIMSKGCQGFIQKPFNITGISKKVREVLEN
jgi:two-component system, cell cycle sensor histidine kinase and response regulator CckA